MSGDCSSAFWGTFSNWESGFSGDLFGEVFLVAVLTMDLDGSGRGRKSAFGLSASSTNFFRKLTTESNLLATDAFVGPFLVCLRSF